MTVLDHIHEVLDLINNQPPAITEFRMSDHTISQFKDRYPGPTEFLGQDQLIGIPVRPDQDIPDGTIRAAYSDGTTKDIP